MMNISRTRRASLERRFDGPIPPQLMMDGAERIRRLASARRLLARLASDYREEIWRQLAATCAALENHDKETAVLHRARLEAVARSLAGLV